MPAERVITERLDAVCKAGTALWHLEQIRDSTLPGTALYLAADKAARAILDVTVELYTQPTGTAPRMTIADMPAGPEPYRRRVLDDTKRRT